jgi:Tol biopolymer transport system component
VVVYELLTGQCLFQGESTVEILGAVLNKEPDLSATPVRVRQLLRWCLEKDRKLRLASISDARRLLRAGEQEPSATPAPRPRHGWIPWAVAAIFFIAAGLLAGVHFREKPAPAQPVRLQIPVPENLKFNSANPPSVSPDGRWVAFTATSSDGVTRIYLRAMDSLEAKPLPGTDLPGPITPPPYWSFDSRFLVFAAGGKLKKIDILGGPPQSICDLPNLAQGAAWNREGTIIFAGVNTGLQRVSASGGSAVPLTLLAPGETAHRFPQFLPDGRHFLYLRVSSAAEKMGIFVGYIDAKPEAQSTKPLLLSGFQGNYVPSPIGGAGWLLFLREGTLLAQPFDPGKLELSGDPIPVASPVGSFAAPTIGLFSVSENGILVYRSGSSGLYRLTWRDTAGNTVGTVGDPGLLVNPAISPDGRRVAVGQVDSQGNADIWVLDVARGTSTRLTFDAHQDTNPVWSPDGARIAFRSNRAGHFDLYERNADGSGEDRLLFQSNEDKAPTSWSHDGQFLLFASLAPRTSGGLWILPFGGGGKPIPFLQTESQASLGQFSPDGRWIAYTSNDSGAFEVYVRPALPNSIGGTSGSGSKWMVSKGGGAFPRWRGDGKQLFYLSLNRQLMAADVTADRTFQTGIPKSLFDSQAAALGTYGVTSDGKKFLFVTAQAANTATPYTVVLNWLPGLKK